MTGWALHLLRHGEPDPAGRLLGRTDAPVTASGVAACTDRARQAPHVRLVASDLRRAGDCARAIGTPAIDPRWRELDFGDWDGLAPADVPPDAMARFWADPDADPPPNGERWSSLTGRVGEALASLAPEPTLVVTHAGPMRAALCLLCGFDLGAAWSIDLPYAALLSFRVWDGPERRAQLVGLTA